MLIENLIKCTGRRVAFEKFNLSTGEVDPLKGVLIDAGIAHQIGDVQFAVIEEEISGREWITLASCVKEVLE
jgi:hypothetical protein